MKNSLKAVITFQSTEFLFERYGMFFNVYFGIRIRFYAVDELTVFTDQLSHVLLRYHELIYN